MFLALFHGMILAFGLILPLGAQNIFVFNQGAAQTKFRAVIPVVITASLCDTFLILLAVLGVSVVVFTVPALQTLIFSVGILFLLYMGWSIWHSHPVNIQSKGAGLSSKKQMIFAMSVSLLNPHAILDTIGVIGTSSLSYTGKEKIAFSAACILISWLWFFGLALAGNIIGSLDTQGQFLKMINKVSAMMIWSVALYLAIQLFKLL